jgi:hypothetical protein
MVDLRQVMEANESKAKYRAVRPGDHDFCLQECIREIRSVPSVQLVGYVPALATTSRGKVTYERK